MSRSSNRQRKRAAGTGRCFEPLERRVLMTNVVINGTSGADTITVEDLPGDSTVMRYGVAGGSAQLIPWANVDSITINADAGADTIRILRVRNNAPTTINGEGGSDVAQLGDGDIDSHLGGSILFNGGTGTDRIELLDTADAAGPDTHDLFYASEAGAFPFFYQKTGFAAPSEGVVWDGTTEQVRLELSNRGDTVNIDHDVANVTVIGGSGADHVNWGNGDIDTQMGAARLYFSGGANPAGDPDTLLLDDINDAGADTHRFARAGAVGSYSKDNISGMAEFTGVEDVHLVTAQNQSTATFVDGLPESTDLFVEGVNFGADTITIGAGDIDSNVLGNVSFDGFSGGIVNFDDSTDGPGADFYTIDFGTFTNSTSTHTFSNVASVTLNASPNSDVINIENSFGYELVVHGNNGDDAITIGDGDLTGAGQATIYGGAGVDTLRFDDTTGADSDDIAVDTTGAATYVDILHGSVRTRYDSITTLSIDASPHDDTITSVAVPMLTTLRIDGNAGNDSIDVQGHPVLNDAVLPRVVVDGGSGNDTVEVNTDGVGGARVTFEVSQTLDRLTLGAGGRLRLAEGQHLIDVLSSFGMPASGAELDLTDGFFVRRNSVSLPFYTARVATGYNGGAWNGLGINSSVAAASSLPDALGTARASDLFGGAGGTIAGIHLAPNDILIRYTTYGDADLNGTVNFDDYVRTDNGFNQGLSGWVNGDFDYSGDVDFDDYVLIDLGFNS
jgi:hypothetical protein